MAADLLIAMTSGIRSKKQIKTFYSTFEKDFPHDPDVLERHFRETIEIIQGIFVDRLRQSEFRRIHLFYTLFTAIFHARFGLPNMETVSIATAATNYAKIAIAFEKIESIYATEDIKKLSAEEIQFLQDSRRATTDGPVRIRRKVPFVAPILRESVGATDASHRSLIYLSSGSRDHKSYIGRAFTQDAAGAYVLTEQERSFIVDSALLRIFIGWETFLEKSVVAYMMGNASSVGRKPTRFVSPTSEVHAHQILIGTQKYVDWANPDIVRKLTQLHFENGEPVGAVVSSIHSDLLDMKTVRNAAAHLTTTTAASIDALATRKLEKPSSGIAVSHFILSIDPKGDGTLTILDGYLGLLDTAADQIANWS